MSERLHELCGRLTRAPYAWHAGRARCEAGGYMGEMAITAAMVVGAVVAFLASEAVRELERRCEALDEAVE